MRGVTGKPLYASCSAAAVLLSCRGRRAEAFDALLFVCGSKRTQRQPRCAKRKTPRADHTAAAAEANDVPLAVDAAVSASSEFGTCSAARVPQRSSELSPGSYRN
jgi:hypothetical protein